MLNFLIQCGCYKKIYDSYKHDDVYGALYQIRLGLRNYEKNEHRMKNLEHEVVSQDDHVRIYVNVEGYMKQVMVKKSNKIVLVKWFMMQVPESVSDDTKHSKKCHIPRHHTILS